jgi:hypothetical protein
VRVTDWEGELPLNRFLIGYGLVMLGFPITRISLLALYHHMLQHVSDVSATPFDGSHLTDFSRFSEVLRDG